MKNFNNYESAILYSALELYISKNNQAIKDNNQKNEYLLQVNKRREELNKKAEELKKYFENLIDDNYYFKRG